MSETTRLVDQLQRAYNGDAWYGPSVRSALEGVDAALASRRPSSGAHSIGEIVLHVTSWTREVTRRLRTGVAQEPEDGDWPAASIATDGDWQRILSALDAANDELQAVVAAISDGELEGRIGDVRDRALGSGVSRYVTIHGLVQHHAYHAGQIAILRKGK